jgi:phosphoribosylformimino-5-aminoimidazole carboxamide ribotide isomerase
MDLIPAIDLLDAKAVRLRQGSYEDVTVYHDAPVELARAWSGQAKRLHVVDLDGSRAGKPVQLALVERLVQAFGPGVQVGGGIRSLETILAYVQAGVERVVLGTAALREPELVEEAALRFAGRVIVAVDARGGLVATQGWLEQSETPAVELVRRFAALPLGGVLYTDIERDGTEVGPNLSETARLAREGGVPVIVSGGVGSLEHLRAVGSFGATFSGVIVGRALHEKRFSLKEALEALGGA